MFHNAFIIFCNVLTYYWLYLIILYYILLCLTIILLYFTNVDGFYAMRSFLNVSEKYYSFMGVLMKYYLFVWVTYVVNINNYVELRYIKFYICHYKMNYNIKYSLFR